MSESPEVRFQRFLAEFRTEDGKPKYREKLAQLSVTGSNSLIVDFIDLDVFDSEWASALLSRPTEYLHYANAAAMKQLKIEDPEFAEEVGEVAVRFRALAEKVLLRRIGAEHLGKFVMVDGIVIRSTPAKPTLVRGAFRCKRCGYISYIDQTEFFMKTPTKCEECGRMGPFELLAEESTFIDAQDIRIQEKPEDLPPGQLPRSVDVRLVGDLVDVARPGDRVAVTGIIKALRGFELITAGRRIRRPKSFDAFIEGNYVDTLEKEIEVIITPEEEEAIVNFSKDPILYQKLMRSIAPSIYGYEGIKEAIMYSLFGAPREVMPDGTTLRGDIHVLLIGDPGTAKSQLLQYVAQLAPRGLYTSGRGTTGVGLTAAVVRERIGLALEAGALVLADQGICCIDEIDKMRPEDRVTIHEAMEQQTVSVAKGGIVATLNARTAIVAAANPALGRYDAFRTVAENIALPITILSRFDLIFVMRDEPHRETDRAMAEHILYMHRSGEPPVKPPLSQEFLRKYIAYAKRVRPTLSEAAMRRLEEFYLRMRSVSSESRGSPIAISPRQLESLIRIAKARARAALREVVLVEDAEAAINLMRRSLEQVGIDVSGRIDIDLIMTGKPKALRDKLGQVLSVVTKLEKESGMAMISDVHGELIEQGMDRVEVDRLINQLMREGMLFSPKPGCIKRV